MNIKINEESIIFRITEDELNILRQESLLEKRVRFCNHYIAMVIEVSQDISDMRMILIPDRDEICFTLTISPDHLTKLFTMGRDRDGIKQILSDKTIFLQVDVKKDNRPILTQKERS